MNYETYEKKCKEITKENNQLLNLFEKELVESGLKSKTIQNHISNVNFYINTYLLREDALSMEYGTQKIDDFLGYFFIRKCAWSTPASIKSTAASIKKFYKCMLKHEKISKEDYEDLCETIKFNMEFWQDDCESYNNGYPPFF